MFKIGYTKDNKVKNTATLSENKHGINNINPKMQIKGQTTKYKFASFKAYKNSNLEFLYARFICLPSLKLKLKVTIIDSVNISVTPFNT